MHRRRWGFLVSYGTQARSAGRSLSGYRGVGKGRPSRVWAREDVKAASRGRVHGGLEARGQVEILDRAQAWKVD